jgi:hypothetical protein
MTWDPKAIASAAAKWLVIGVLVATVAVVSWRHYTSLLDAKTELTSERDKALGRAEAAEGTINQWSASQAQQAQALRDLAAAQREAGNYSKGLIDVLSKHDLAALAASKPGLVEARVNAGTERALRMLEQSTTPGGTDGPAKAGSAGAPGGPAR